MLLPPKEVASYVEAWQRCNPNHVPNLFYAFNEENTQTERVVSYKLGMEEVQQLRKLNPSEIRIHMGCRSGIDDSNVQQIPPFAPILQAYKSGLNKYENCLSLKWDPTPSFLTKDLFSVNSGVDQIPPEAAYLFILAWLECSYSDLANPFEAITTNLVKRVKFYSFEQEETKEIIKSINRMPDGAYLYIHLGVGISVRQHPFSFRPVLQVVPLESSFDDDGDDGDFYDFSNPCPPKCG
ncbi:MAG: hypothetical protein AAFO07_10840 [Bacteroidota bacterium]